ncbi:MAG: hypothetical protein ACLS6O_00180 [Bifidobacterium sp.]
MDEMTWTDPQLKARYERTGKLERLKETLPNLYSRTHCRTRCSRRTASTASSGCVSSGSGAPSPAVQGDDDANVLEEHLRDIETRTRERQAQIMDQLMESGTCSTGRTA